MSVLFNKTKKIFFHVWTMKKRQMTRWQDDQMIIHRKKNEFLLMKRAIFALDSTFKICNGRSSRDRTMNSNLRLAVERTE